MSLSYIHKNGQKIIHIPLQKASHKPDHLVGLINLLSKTHAQLLNIERYSLIEVKDQLYQAAMIEEKTKLQTLKSLHGGPGLELDIKLQSQSYIQKKKHKKRHFTVELTNIMNTLFTGIIEVGTPPQQFSVIFDTGSALTFISSIQCRELSCIKSNQYDSLKSSSFEPIQYDVEVQFGSGTLKGLINKETISINNLDLKHAFFIEITSQQGDAFRDGEFDGIVGLGFPRMTGLPTLFDFMMKQKVTIFNIQPTRNQKKINLEKQNSQIIFGGVDNSLIKGKWRYYSVAQKYYWSVNCNRILVGKQNTKICSRKHKCRLVFDTGTSLMTGPSDEIKQLLQFIGVQPNCQNLNELPEISFRIGKHKYSLSPQEYILTINQNGVEQPFQHSYQSDIVGCAGAIYPLDVPKPQGPVWVLGDIFLSKYAISFDRNLNRIGIARNNFD